MVVFMCPVLKSKLQQGVIYPLRRMGVHLNHVFEEGFQLPWIVGKYRDEFFRAGLKQNKYMDITILHTS